MPAGPGSAAAGAGAVRRPGAGRHTASPAEDHVEGRLDLNEHLIRHPAATFFVRASGDSMLGAGIHPGDLLVVDRSLEPAHGKVVIAVVDNELTVKRLEVRDGRVRLLAENDRYPPIACAEGTDLQIWGVVTSVVHTPQPEP